MLLLIDGICETDSLPMIETVGTNATIQYVKSAPALNTDNFGLALQYFQARDERAEYFRCLQRIVSRYVKAVSLCLRTETNEVSRDAFESPKARHATDLTR